MKNARFLAVVSAASLSAGLLALAPAQAGATWSGPSEVSSKFGRTVVVSDGGRVAAWVRTNKTSSSASGPIRTAWYLKKKKKWTSSAPIPGASESTNVQLSNDGNAALIESGTTGYLMSVRDTKNTWLTAQSIVSGMDLGSGVMSGDAKTLGYVDWGPDDYPTPAGKLYFVTQNADGTWPAPTMLGTANPEGRYGYQSVLAFSKDGSTLVWVDSTYALVGTTRNPDGTWTAPTIIKQYGSDPDLRTLALSADGSRVIWTRSSSDGVLTSTRSGTAWATISNVTVDETYTAAMSPNGLNVAWANTDNQMVIRRWDGAAWKKVKVLGSTGYYPSIVVQDKTLAWTYTGYKGSSLRSAIYKGGKWTSVVKHSSTGFSPTVSYDGKTLGWSATGNKRIYCVKR